MKRPATSKIDSADRRFSAWKARHYSAEMVHQAEVLPLRRDMVTLLTFARDSKVVGTRSTGNMPRKAIREVTAHFVKPPILDTTIGDRIYRLRTEAEVWSLHFLHILAEVGGLLATAPAQRWRLTSKGEDFLETHPLLQVPFLLMVWWYDVNWLVAYPREGMGDELPSSFELDTLAYLCSYPVGTFVRFERFADRLIEKTGLTWGTKDGPHTAWLLQSSIVRMVSDVLVAFGAIESERRDELVGEGLASRISAFAITPFGEALLGSIMVGYGRAYLSQAGV